MALLNIPNPPQTLGNTNASIRQNWTTIDNGFSVNHIAFGAPDVGKHSVVTFPNLAVPALPSGTEFQLYNATAVAVGSTKQIFLHRGGAAVFPLTQYYQAADGSKGWCYLPSGMKMAFGVNNVPSGQPRVQVLFTSVNGPTAADAFPGFTNVPVVSVTRARGSTSNNFITTGDTTGAPANNFPTTNTYFYAYKSGGSSSAVDEFTWTAIGF